MKLILDYVIIVDSLTLGQMFASVGMGKQAVEAYLRCNKISSAIDTCVNLNQWHSGNYFISLLLHSFSNLANHLGN